METIQQSKEMTPEERSLASLRPPFKPGQSGPENRVPAELVKVFGKDQARKIFKLNDLEIEEWDAILLSMTVNQLKLLAQWDGASAYPKGLAISILWDMKNGSTKTLDKLRERIGKPSQRLITFEGETWKDIEEDSF